MPYAVPPPPFASVPRVAGPSSTPRSRRRAALVVGAVGLLVGLAACSGSGDDEPKVAATTTTTTRVAVGAELQLGDVAVQSAGGDIALDAPTQQAAVDVAQQYLDAAVFAPLLEGEVGKAYAALFDGGVSAAATEADRRALTDEGVPAMTATPKITVTPVRVDALADKDGALRLMAATFTVDIAGKTGSGDLTIHRTNELTLAPTDGGGWLVTAYRVAVTRDLAGAQTTTTAEAGNGTTTTEEGA